MKVLRDRLARSSERDRPIAFWLRDDDAVEPSPALDRLLALAGDVGVPAAIAVIPADATDALAERLQEEVVVTALQHGWRHAEHQPSEAKKTELGEHRPTETMLEELGRGCERMQTLFRDTFRPVLVPPWNRVSPSLATRRAEIGLVGLSTYGAASAADRHQVNTHVDLIDWRAGHALDRDVLIARVAEELDRRLAGDPEPIGILTHHLRHDEAAWRLLDELLEALGRAPGLVWPSVDALFRLAQGPTRPTRSGA